MKHTLVSIIFVIIAMLNAAVAADNIVFERGFELPGHGQLLMQVPAAWDDQIRQPPNKLPPTLRFTRTGGERFVVLLTPLWRTPQASADFNSDSGIKRLVANASKKVAENAVETEVTLIRFGGSTGGYYFSVTDSKYKPGPGEYRYMTQGAVGTGEVLCPFTVLSNTENSMVVRQAIRMLKSMQHIQPNTHDVVN